MPQPNDPAKAKAAHDKGKEDRKKSATYVNPHPSGSEEADYYRGGWSYENLQIEQLNSGILQPHHG